MRIAVTGHRPHKLGPDGYNPENKLRRIIRSHMRAILLEQKATQGISGMALGIDQDFAQVCVSLGIPFIAAIPFLGQESKWPAESQKSFKTLLEKASEVVYVCDSGYAAWKMQKRNEYMVQACDKLIAVWDGTSGGTANCVSYAKKIGKTIIRIPVNELR